MTYVQVIEAKTIFLTAFNQRKNMRRSCSDVREGDGSRWMLGKCLCLCREKLSSSTLPLCRGTAKGGRSIPMSLPPWFEGLLMSSRGLDAILGGEFAIRNQQALCLLWCNERREKPGQLQEKLRVFQVTWSTLRNHLQVATLPCIDKDDADTSDLPFGHHTCINGRF